MGREPFAIFVIVWINGGSVARAGMPAASALDDAA